jgi:hypothetical protein
MKMGTIAWPWRYDATFNTTQPPAAVRFAARWRYAPLGERRDSNCRGGSYWTSLPHISVNNSGTVVALASTRNDSACARASWRTTSEARFGDIGGV